MLTLKRPLAPGAVLLACALLAGCGSIGEPLYPALNMPFHVTDLTAVERGDKIDVRFTIQPRTTEGMVLQQVGSVDLRIGPVPVTGFNPNDWANDAKKIDVSPLPQPGAAHVDVPARDFIGKNLLVAVRLGNTKGRMTDWSNYYPVTVEQPLSNPADVKAESVAEGVRVTWSAPNQPAFRIFRKAGDQKEPSELAKSDKPEYVDTSTEYGTTYQYFVQGLHDKTESDIVESNGVTPKDIFPPQVPSGLTASAGVGSIELAWSRNAEADFKEYRVFRSEGDGPFTQIAAGLEAPFYSDHGIESGKHYRYRISALDQTGNESAPSEPVQIIAP
jgi:hypothetical protein